MPVELKDIKSVGAEGSGVPCCTNVCGDHLGGEGPIKLLKLSQLPEKAALGHRAGEGAGRESAAEFPGNKPRAGECGLPKREKFCWKEAFPGKGSEGGPEYGRVLHGTRRHDLFGPGLIGGPDLVDCELAGINRAGNDIATRIGTVVKVLRRLGRVVGVVVTYHQDITSVVGFQ